MASVVPSPSAGATMRRGQLASCQVVPKKKTTSLIFAATWTGDATVFSGHHPRFCAIRLPGAVPQRWVNDAFSPCGIFWSMGHLSWTTESGSTHETMVWIVRKHR